MMGNVASIAQRLPVSGVEEQGKQFCNLPFVVGLLGGLAAPFTAMNMKGGACYA